MNKSMRVIPRMLLVTLLVLVPAFARAASVGLGATVMCAWWDSSVKTNMPMFGASSADAQGPFAAGGPFLTAQINDAWGINLGYTYGKFTSESSSPILGNKSVEQRHDVDFVVSAAVHRYVRIFFGAKYWGQRAEMTTSVLFFSYRSSIARDQGGPGLGLGLSLPLGAGFYLLPNASAVFMFGNITPQSGGPIGLLTGTLLKTSDVNSVAMYYGINSTLSIAYNIEKANLTLAIGGRFQYLWLYFIESERQVDNNDMYAGITFSAMYTFDIPGTGTGKK